MAAVLLLFHVAEDGACLKSLPWSTIVMVLFVMATVGLLVIVAVSALLYNPIANLLYQA